MSRSDFRRGNTSQLKTFKSLASRYKRFICQSLSSYRAGDKRTSAGSARRGHGTGHRLAGRGSRAGTSEAWNTTAFHEPKDRASKCQPGRIW